MKKILLAFITMFVMSIASSAGASGWKPLLELVKQEDGVKSAGIYGQDGPTWSATDDLKLSADEVKAIVAGIKDNSKFKAKGMMAAGVSYTFLKRLSPSSVVGRKGSTSFIATISKKALIVLTTKEGIDPANVKSHEFTAAELLKKGL